MFTLIGCHAMYTCSKLSGGAPEIGIIFMSAMFFKQKKNKAFQHRKIKMYIIRGGQMDSVISPDTKP